MAIGLVCLSDAMKGRDGRSKRLRGMTAIAQRHEH